MAKDEDAKAPEFRPPVLDGTRRIEVHRAAELTRQAHLSDPFAAGRAALYMRRGLVLPSEVKSDAESILNARGVRRADEA